MADEPRPRLGRGLAALLGDNGPEAPAATRGLRRVPIELIRPNPRNPRKTFDEIGLAELADSIRNKGLIQPIVVRQINNSSRDLEIIAGERRWRAAQIAGIHEIPVIVIEATERESLELAIVENVQRADLDAIEEAQGYKQLMDEFSYTQQTLSEIIGKSRSHVANTLRILNLPAKVLQQVQRGELTAGHARALLAFENPEEIAEKAVSGTMTVRDLEELSRQNKDKLSDESRPRRSESTGIKTDVNVANLEKSLSDTLGMKVIIRQKGEGGELRIRYASLEQLDAICSRFE